jgi:hypothetical protein
MHIGAKSCSQPWAATHGVAANRPTEQCVTISKTASALKRPDSHSWEQVMSEMPESSSGTQSLFQKPPDSHWQLVSLTSSLSSQRHFHYCKKRRGQINGDSGIIVLTEPLWGLSQRNKIDRSGRVGQSGGHMEFLIISSNTFDFSIFPLPYQSWSGAGGW